jgi:hypothetical protein
VHAYILKEPNIACDICNNWSLESKSFNNMHDVSGL